MEIGSVEFKAVLNTKDIPAQVAATQQQIAGKDANLKVGADTAKAKGELDGLAKQAGRGVKTPIDADTSLAKQKLKELGDFAKQALGEVGRGIGQGIGINLANSIQGTVAGAVGAVTGTVKEGLDTFIAFQDKLTTFGAVANATKEETKALADEAKRLGIETSKTPVQVGEAAVQLAKLGFSAKDTKEQVEGVVRLSEASGLTDLGKAAEVAGAAFNVFGTNTKKTADVVAATSNATAADAQDLLQAISSAGGVAKANNQSFETLAATFGLLRSAGFQMEAAGTGVKTIISSLAAPTSAEAKNAIEQLGVSVFDASGKMRSLEALIPELRKSLSGLTQQRQASLVKAIFGDGGAAPLLALLSTSQEKIDSTFKTINNASQDNAAGEAAKKLLTGLPGQLKLLEGSVATLKLNLGEAIAPAFEGLAKLGTDTANEILKSSGLLDGLKGSAEGFKLSLEQDPDLAKELALALGEAGKVLADDVASGARSLTEYLKENPRAIADLVSGTVEFVKLLNEAVGVAGKVVDKLGEGAQRLKGLLNPDAGDKEGASKAIQGAGGTKADADAAEKRTQARVRRQSLTTDIGGVPLTFGSIKPQEIEKIRFEETQKQLDEVRKRTLAKPDEDAAKADFQAAAVQKAAAAKRDAGAPEEETFQERAVRKAAEAKADLKVDSKSLATSEGSSSKGAGVDTSEKTASGQLKDIQDFSRDLTLKENKLSESADREIALAKKAQLSRTKTAQETEAAIAQIQAKESQGKVKAIEESIAQIDAAEKTGQIGAKEAATKRSELQKKLASAEKSDLDNQIKARDAANRETLKQFEFQNKQAEAAIARRANASRLSSASGTVETSQIEERTATDTIAQKQKELAATKQQRAAGVLDAREAAEKELAIEQALDNERVKLLGIRRQREQADFEQRSKVANAAIERATAAQTFSARQTQLSGDGVVGEGGQAEIQRIEAEAAQKRLAQAQIDLQEIKKLQQDKVIGSREAENQITENLQKQDAERAKIQDLETQRVLRGIQNVADAQKRQLTAANAGIDQQKASNDLLAGSIQRESQLVEAQAKVSAAVSEARQQQLKAAVDRASEAVDSFKKLQSKDLGTNQRQVLQAQVGQLAGLSISGKVNNADLVKLVQIKQSAEAAADREKLRALQKQNDAERETEKLKLRQAEVTARNNVLEAQRANMSARIAENEQKSALLKALKTGDANEIANAQQGVALASQNVAITGAQIGNAQANAATQREVGQLGLGALDIKQAAAERAQSEQNAAAGRGRARELAETADAAKVKVIGGIDPNGGAAGGGFTGVTYNAGQTFGGNGFVAATAPNGIPTGNPVQEAAGQGMGGGLQQLSSTLSSAIDRLGERLANSMNRPNVTAITANPVADASKILADASKSLVGQAGL
ncbi:MAG: phage tail tape measure protein [Lyngbya sp. HA4199-MV5]|nr:phage tail tape measure protein [Lyngbya sp. HA4199-MV5]